MQLGGVEGAGWEAHAHVHAGRLAGEVVPVLEFGTSQLAGDDV